MNSSGREIDHDYEQKKSNINEAIERFFCDREWCCLRKATPPVVLRDISTSITVFFQDKEWYAGGPISEELLYTKRNFHLINNVSFFEAVGLAYDSIAEKKYMARTGYRDDVEIEVVLSLVKECHKKKIPQEHIGGLLLMYMELCEKVELL